jgi:outer membrane immunogenic protein
MKKLVTCAIAVAGLIGTPAFAADMGVPAAPPPAPVWSWTGWYAGVNAGASFGRAKTDFNFAPLTVANTINLLHFTSPGFGFSDTGDPSGFIGGGQIGYNWQWSPLIVLGLEADIQGALEKDSANLNSPFSLTGPVLTGAGVPNGATGAFAFTAFTDYSTKIEWFGTVRGRIGYVWGNGNVMSYLTGGLAYGKVDIEGTNILSGSVTQGGTAAISVTSAFSHNAVNTGWVAGYGTEGVIDFWGARNWTWKIEALYMDLGTLDTTGVTSSTISTAPVNTLTGGQVTTHTRFTDGILRGGLNYKFY